VTDSGIAAELFNLHQRPLGELAAERKRFTSLLAQALAADSTSCREVCGADNFLHRWRETANIVIGLATGGWAESALAKLRHAGVDITGLAFASADDAEARTDIMDLCQQRAAVSADIDRFAEVTYIGDGLGDAHAAAALGWRFIGIGNGQHAERLRSAGACNVFEDFRSPEHIMHVLASGCYYNARGKASL
jgi:phosphoglycolate phosphatase-like HAD superfamily hydrolase